MQPTSATITTNTPTRTRLPNPRAALRRALAINTPLTLVGLLMSATLLATFVGLLVDPQTITGAPAWLKPAKFAISISIYCFTILWLLTFIQGRRRLITTIANTTAIASFIEMAIIAAQVIRGATSHFNISTLLDAALFSIMGVTILLLWLAAFTLTILLFSQPLTDRAFAWSLRLGAALSVIGMAVAGLMLRPTPAQSATIAAGQSPTHLGAHSVGVPDGGPGLPLLGWSTTGGDLRIPHFFGLHALQILPLLGWLLMTRLPWLDVAHRIALIWATSLAYLGAILLLTWQALRAQSIVHPDAATIAAALALLTLAALTILAILLHGARHPAPTPAP